MNRSFEQQVSVALIQGREITRVPKVADDQEALIEILGYDIWHVHASTGQ